MLESFDHFPGTQTLVPALDAVISTNEYEELRSQVDLLRQEYKIAKAESRTAHKVS